LEVATSKVVIQYEPPHACGFRFEGHGMPLARLSAAVELLKYELLKTMSEATTEFGVGVTPATVWFEWDAEKQDVLTCSDGYFPPYLLVNALKLLDSEVLGRQQQMMLAAMARQQASQVQAATPDMVPPVGKIIH